MTTRMCSNALAPPTTWTLVQIWSKSNTGVQRYKKLESFEGDGQEITERPRLEPADIDFKEITDKK